MGYGHFNGCTVYVDYNRFIDLTMYSKTKPFLILYFGFGDFFEPGHPVI